MFLQQGCIELQLKRNESNEETHKRCPKNLDHYILFNFELKKHALGMFYKSLKTEFIHKGFDYKIVIFNVIK